jgi:DNA mismatch repair protein MutS
MSNGTANPRDFVSLKSSLKALPRLVETTKNAGVGVFNSIEEHLNSICEYTDLIEKTINDNPPILIKEGGVIKEGVDNTLDYLRDLMTNGEEWLKNFEEKEKEKTGITTLKVGYNRVFGYYIEVTNSYKDKVPFDYIRRQTLANAERYITQELKEVETKILTSEEKLISLENALYNEIKSILLEKIDLFKYLRWFSSGKSSWRILRESPR